LAKKNYIPLLRPVSNTTGLYRNLLHLIAGFLDENKLKDIRELFVIYLDNESKAERKLKDVIKISESLIGDFGLAYTSVVSLFLYELKKTGIISQKEIEKKYDKKTVTIVENLVIIHKLDTRKLEKQADDFVKLLLSSISDVRVILIRLALQVYAIESLKSGDKVGKEYAEESFYLYAPLAHRLGLYRIKQNLEDEAFRILQPNNYKQILKKLYSNKVKRETFINNFLQPIEKSLKESELKFEIKWRAKSVYSIYKKMQKQGVPFEQVYDRYAIRIIIDENENEKEICWRAFSVVTALYESNSSRLRDWITHPKETGYESLHITVLNKEGQWVEVQIRTKRMDEVAEKGLAAHWKYKEGRPDQEYDLWLKKIRDILEHPEKDLLEYTDNISEIDKNEIFVFTPNGDLKRLPANATVLDMAYSIHTNVGNKCSGARVNNKLVPIKYRLSNGENVEIVTSPNQKPKLDWLKIAVSGRAKNKIRRFLNEDFNKTAGLGKDALLRKLKNWKVEFNDDLVNKLVKHYKCRNSLELYSDIYLEKIENNSLKATVFKKTEKAQENKSPLKKEIKSEVVGNDILVIDNQTTNINYKFSKCCNPVQGDDILGFITVGKGISIHKSNCTNAIELLKRYPYRMIEAEWNKNASASAFPARIKVIADDKPGILNSITEIVSIQMNINLKSISFDSHKNNFVGSLEMIVKDNTQLEHTIANIKKIKGVRKVSKSG
jgi:guanosine-3',5'-bis(diphosphate) 3'-pyrophosphohydrolase